MSDSDTNQATGEPGQSSPEPAAAGGIQPGGLSPSVTEAIAQLPPEQRSVVEKDILQRNQYVTAQRERFANDIQKAGILDQMTQDPEFNRYMEARQSGDMMKFYRHGLESYGQPVPAVEQPDNLQADEPGAGADPVQSPGATAPEVLDIKRRLEAMELRDAQARQNSEAAEFAKANPNFENYLADMMKVKQRLPNASLQDIYNLAQFEAGAPPAPEAAGGASNTQPPAATSSPQPPPAVGVSADVSKEAPKRSRSVADAFQQAKLEHGIEGALEVVFR